MLASLTGEEARSLLTEFGGWFGPPRILWRRSESLTETIDGRTRFREAVALRMTAIPTKTVTTAGDAARLLCWCGHYARARAIVPIELTDCRDVAAYCHCSPELVSPMTIRRPTVPKNDRARNTARRREVISTIRHLLQQAENTDGIVTPDELRAALRAWI
jgi:hypothetical protein